MQTAMLAELERALSQSDLFTALFDGQSVCYCIIIVQAHAVLFQPKYFEHKYLKITFSVQFAQTINL